MRKGVKMGMILNGVLRMPPSCWSGDELDIYQRYSLYREAADLIEKQQTELESLRRDAERYRKLRDAKCDIGKLRSFLFMAGDAFDAAIDEMEAADAKP